MRKRFDSNLFATGLKCTICGVSYSVVEKCTVCDRCGGLLEVQYDYDAMRSQLEKNDLQRSNVWTLRRYLKILPIRSEFLVSLGEGCTPMVQTKRLLTGIGLNLKLDYVMPTGSFKDRGAATIVSKANELGVKTVAIDSSGNAAASVSAYAARAGIPCYVFVPHYTHSSKIVQVCSSGATAIKVRGTREDVHNLIEAAYRRLGWYYCGFMVSPYAIEGMKTIAYEICEQLHWNPPDWIVFPVATGSGIAGCYKGFQELLKLGWIGKLPRLVCIQPEGCAPIAEAYRNGKDEPIPVPTPKTIAEGLAVGSPPKGRFVLNAIRKTNGLAEIVTDSEILESAKDLASMEGLYVEASSAASVAGVAKLLSIGMIERNETVVCELTGTGLKSQEEHASMARSPLETPPDFDSLLQVLRSNLTDGGTRGTL